MSLSSEQWGRCPSPVPDNGGDAKAALDKYPKLRPLFLMVFLESCGTALTAPVITFFVMDEMNGSSFELGMVGSAFAAAQVFGAGLAGRCSDAYGRRAIMVLSFFMSALGFFGTAFVQTIPQMVFVRAFAGISGGTWPICQAYAVDVVPEEDRGTCLGLLSASFASGFVIGPGLATFLLTFDLADRRMVFALSGIICLAGCLTGGMFLKESLSEASMRPLEVPDLGCNVDRADARADADAEEAQLAEAGRPAKKTMSDMEAVNLGVVCMWLLRFAAAFAQYIVYAMYSPLFEDYFGMGDKEMGLMLVVGGVLAVFMQALCFGWSCQHAGEAATLGVGCVALGVSLTLIPIVRNFRLHIAVMLLYVVGEGFIEPGTPLMLAQFAPSSHQGFANGVGSAFRGVAAVTGPLVGGELYSHCKGCVFSFAACWGFLALLLVVVARVCGTRIAQEKDDVDETSVLLNDSKLKGRNGSKASTAYGEYGY
eukprot:TRINITY_DN22712_c0_g1_i1.p1 TRINITY_DN22712_c0_g1~~TRINITY_DN22712_c0_g1_i1.p1  ORF type:complete len:482 (+),score=90.16 TRINITY_DN22712_c0_g1_i1:116-1561(+)